MTRRLPVRRETSAGGVVFRRAAGRDLVLVIRDAHGNWGFPKGHVERGEDAATAARREVREETGVEGLEQLAPLDAISWSFRSRGARIHKTCHYYAFTTAHARTRPQREEGITACRWFTPAQARRRLTHESARSVLDAAVQVAGHLPAGAAVAAEA